MVQGFKMLCFRIVSTGALNPAHQVLIGSTMRDYTYWTPCVPPERLNLNDGNHSYGYSGSQQQKPLSWSHFGGDGGKLLPFVTAIRIIHTDKIEGIVFDYDNKNLAREWRTLGRPQSDVTATSRCRINGYEGERIAEVLVSEIDYSIGMLSFLKPSPGIVGLQVRCLLYL